LIPRAADRDEPKTAFIAAWVLCLVFYFLQYALRSAPGVMMPELTAAFGLTTLGIGSLVGLYYYTYAGFAIVAGATLDRYGAKLPIFVGVLTTALGSVLFGLGSIGAAESGRLLQGAGSAFAFTGAVYLAVHGFSARWLATAIGFTQLAGMLGRCFVPGLGEIAVRWNIDLRQALATACVGTYCSRPHFLWRLSRASSPSHDKPRGHGPKRNAG
jgi:MFS family permease